MATITRTVEETLIFTAKPPRKLMSLQKKPSTPRPELRPPIEASKDPQPCPSDCEECKNSPQLSCPPDCKDCKNAPPLQCPPNCKECQQITQSKAVPLLFNAIGIIIAILATYMMISTDSKIYMVFWVFYSVLRRMMAKTKAFEKEKVA